MPLIPEGRLLELTIVSYMSKIIVIHILFIMTSNNNHLKYTTRKLFPYYMTS